MPTMSSRTTSFGTKRLACAATNFGESATPAPKAAKSAKPPRIYLRYMESSLCPCRYPAVREDYSVIRDGGYAQRRNRSSSMHRACRGELVIAAHGVGDLAEVELDAVVAFDQHGDAALARHARGEIKRLVDETEFLIKTARPLLGGKLLDAGGTAIDPVHGDLASQSSVNLASGPCRGDAVRRHTVRLGAAASTRKMEFRSLSAPCASRRSLPGWSFSGGRSHPHGRPSRAG